MVTPAVSSASFVSAASAAAILPAARLRYADLPATTPQAAAQAQRHGGAPGAGGVDGTGAAGAATPVTLLITRKVAPGCHRDFQAWLRQGTLLAAGFPGFLGSGVLSPSEGSDTFQVMMRFADEGCLAAWERSLSRRMWLDRGAALTQSSEWQRVDGLELIFGRIADDGGPARWQRAIMVWMFLFPVALTFNTLLAQIPGLPVPLRVMATTMAQVPLMIYVGAPLINRLWQRYRYRVGRSRRND